MNAESFPTSLKNIAEEIEILRCIPKLNDRQLGPLVAFASKNLIGTFIEQVITDSMWYVVNIYNAVELNIFEEQTMVGQHSWPIVKGFSAPARPVLTCHTVLYIPTHTVRHSHLKATTLTPPNS